VEKSPERNVLRNFELRTSKGERKSGEGGRPPKEQKPADKAQKVGRIYIGDLGRREPQKVGSVAQTSPLQPS